MFVFLSKCIAAAHSYSVCAALYLSVKDRKLHRFSRKTGSFTSSHAIPFHFISCYFILFHFVSFIQKTEKLERAKETKASLNRPTEEEETAKVERGMPTSHRNCLFPFGTCTAFAQSQKLVFENNLGHRPWGLRVFCS